MQAVDESKILMQSPALTWLVYAALVLARVLVALFIYDTWQYWVHLGLHMKFLYREFSGGSTKFELL
jgi:sterol desaturase/sphingolipid hydroxylase (fatty acid hydroxylase superfamily)